MPKNKLINLLPQEEFDISITGRVLKWAMGTFRIIVIITEMIVMGAFLSRFWLDAQNSDLNDSIKVKSAQISAQKDFEKQFKGLQSRLNVFKQLKTEAKASEKIQIVSSKIPSDVNLSEISILDNSIQVKGLAGSEASIAQFISNLKAEKSFKNIDLGQINSPESNPGITIFSIAITY